MLHVSCSTRAHRRTRKFGILCISMMSELCPVEIDEQTPRGDARKEGSYQQVCAHGVRPHGRARRASTANSSPIPRERFRLRRPATPARLSTTPAWTSPAAASGRSTAPWRARRRSRFREARGARLVKAREFRCHLRRWVVRHRSLRMRRR